MTRKTFYKKLRSVADKFTWSINSCNELSAKPKDGGGMWGKYCPITAVTLAYNLSDDHIGNFDYAAAHLGLSKDDSIFIVGLADNTGYTESKGFGSARKNLLKSVGLAPQA